MEKVLATPKDGVLVRHENGKPLETSGELVERNSYWLRRAKDGDVTLVVQSATNEAAGSTAAASSKKSTA